MDEFSKDAAHGLVVARVDTGLKSLDNNVRYQEISKRQDDNTKEVMQIIKKLDKESDRKKVHDYYDDEIHKFLFELDAVYIQGFKDCFNLLGFLKES